MDTSQPEARRGGLLERLAAGPVIGDGGFVFELEKRGYVKAGPWTPEVVVEHPEAVRQLHREFLRAGSDVMQALTFYASDDKLSDRGNTAQEKYTSAAINKQACVIAREIADEGGALMGAGVTQCPAYTGGGNKQQVQDIFRKQVKVFVENGCDFVLCEYFEHIEEMEWAIEVCKKTASLPIAATMCIGPAGDRAGVTTGECAVRMAKAGADLVGVNCNFGPETALGSMRLMKEALDQEGLAPYLICQPVGFLTPDANKRGAVDLPEFPFALEPRMCTRWQIHKYAREAHEMGIRYIGGCCGFESYHIRAVAEELATERGRVPAASEKHSPWGAALSMSMLPQMAARANREYWETMEPATGRPRSAAFAHIRPST